MITSKTQHRRLIIRYFEVRSFLLLKMKPIKLKFQKTKLQKVKKTELIVRSETVKSAHEITAVMSSRSFLHARFTSVPGREYQPARLPRRNLNTMGPGLNFYRRANVSSRMEQRTNANPDVN